MARLRHQTFFTLAALNQAIRLLLDDLNQRPFKKLPGTRLSQFEQLDKPALRALPAQPYQYGDQSLGYNLRFHKCVYTTTEEITKKAIELMMRERREEYYVHDEMNEIAGGKITISGTGKVRKKFDGITPLIVRRLNKEKYETRLIADGLSSEWNHSNSKPPWPQTGHVRPTRTDRKCHNPILPMCAVSTMPGGLCLPGPA